MFLSWSFIMYWIKVSLYSWRGLKSLLTCSWPPSQTWMLLSYAGLTTPISYHWSQACVGSTWVQPASLHSNLLIHFWTGDTSPRVYLELASTHGVNRGWSAAFSSKYTFSVKLCVCLCNVFWWQGSDSEVECVAPHWRIGRNFLLPRIPRPFSSSFWSIL